MFGINFDRLFRRFVIVWAGASATYSFLTYILAGRDSRINVTSLIYLIVMCFAVCLVGQFTSKIQIKNIALDYAITITAEILCLAILWIFFIGVENLDGTQLLLFIIMYAMTYIINTFLIIRMNRIDAKKINSILAARRGEQTSE